MKIAFIIVAYVLLCSGSTYAAPLGTKTTLGNGAILLVAERHNVPMVVLNMLFKSGAAADPAGKEGIANLTAELLTRGTKKYAAQALAQELDFLGTSLVVDADVETTTVSMTTLAKNLDASFALLSEVLLHPTFPAAELDRKRKEIEGSLKSREEDPGWVARRAFQEKLYPNHPYGRLVEGQPSSLANITREDVAKFHQAEYLPNNVIIALAGDVTQEQAINLLTSHFANWQAGTLANRVWPEDQPPSAAEVIIDKDVTQANILLGHPGIARANPDYYAVQLMNYVLGGGGFGSRLMDKIREELGLVYHISSSFSARKHAGPFTVILQTKNESASHAIEETRGQIARLVEGGVSENELAAAKAYFVNSFPLRLVSNRDVAGLLPILEFYELGLDYPDRYSDLINQVTLDHVNKAAKTYLYSDKLLQVIVADVAKAGLKQ